MLTLREIELRGFKSFADRTRMQLPGEVLAAVGPNGSGKSNVVDSVLWALGEQSPKSLRGQKMQDVIFNGTHKRPPAGMAEVILHFQEDDRGTIHVGRRLLRSGESSYLMEGRPVRLKDVHDFLRRHGVSTQGTFLVEQGSVAELLAASPEERRSVIEEVAGIVQFKENRRSSVQKLEAAQGNLLRLNDILTELEAQLTSLKRQARRADRHAELAEELRQKRREFWGRSFGILANRAKAGRRDLDLLRAEGQKRTALLSQLEAEWEASKQRLAEHETSLETLQQTIHEMDLDRERAEGDNKRRTDQHMAGEARLRQIATDCEEIQIRHKSSEEELETLREEFQSLQKAEGEAEKKVEEARGSLDACRLRLEEASSNSEGLRNSAFGLAQDFSRVSTSLKGLDEDIRRQEERLKRLDRESEALNQKEERAQEALEDRRAAREYLEKAWREAEAEAKAAGERAGEAEVELAETTKRHALSDRVQAAEESRLEVLREQESSLRSSAHTYLQEHAAERITPTLAEVLAGVEPRFIPPLAAAYAPLLEGYTEAEWEGLGGLLSILRDEKGGMATFHLKGTEGEPELAPEGSPQAAGFLGWLPDAAGRADLSGKLLTRVALVEGPENAKAFSAKYGVPSVTPDGIYLDPGGWIRGGEGGGPAALLVYEQEMRRTEKALAQATGEAKAAKEAMEKAAGVLREAREAQEKSRKEEERTRREFQAAAVELEKAEEELRRVESSRELLQTEIHQANEEQEEWRQLRVETQRELEALTEKRDGVDRRLKECEEGIRGERSAQERAHEAVTIHTAKLSEIAQSLKASEGAFQNGERRIGELRETLKRLEGESSTIETRNTRLRGEITLGHKSLQTMLIQLEEHRRKKTQAMEATNALNDECSRSEKRVREARSLLEEIREDLGKQEVALTSLEADLRHLKDRIEEVFEENPEELGAAFREDPPIEDEERESIQKDLRRMETRLESMGPVNLLAREEYDTKKKRYDFLIDQREDLNRSIASLEETIRRINRTTRDRFMESFESVQEHFSHLFKQVFEGGEARLSLLDPANPLETGLEIYAQPPGKKLQNLTLLSGGEKAMVAIALLFALFRHRPQPFFILDEVDAALDEVNTEQFNRLLGQFRGQTQFIIVTHNKRTMEMADVLYGVTMVERGVSRVVSVRLDDVQEDLDPDLKK